MAKFNPEKQYTWQQDDVFEMSGKDFGLILNTFRAVLNTEQASLVLATHRASIVMESVLAQNIERGIGKEVVSTSPNVSDEAVNAAGPKTMEVVKDS